MTKKFVFTVVLAAVAAGVNAQPRGGAASPSGEKWCDVLSLDHATAAGGVGEDAWGAGALTKLQAAGCKAGDIVSFRNFAWKSAAAARFCDFTQSVYSDGEAVVCRWTGKLREANPAVLEP